jgi:hypothetical protein
MFFIFVSMLAFILQKNAYFRGAKDECASDFPSNGENEQEDLGGGPGF